LVKFRQDVINWFDPEAKKTGSTQAAPRHKKGGTGISDVSHAQDARATNKLHIQVVPGQAVRRLPKLEGELAAQLDCPTAKVARAVVVKERTGYIREGKGNCANPELVGAIEVVLIHEER